jgi:hypothetical protein
VSVADAGPRYSAGVTAPRPRRDKAFLGLIIFVAVLGVCMAGATATDIVNAVTGTRGTVTVTACTRDNGAHGKTVTYDCTGTYVSADGRTTLTGVTFRNSSADDPGDTRQATLNGSTADDVNLLRPASVATGITVFTVCLVAVVLLLVLRSRRSGRRRP